MSGFQFTKEEQDAMNFQTNVSLPTQYERGDYESLALTMNSVVAANLKNQTESVINDTSMYDGSEFNKENLQAQIDMIEDPNLRANLMQSNIYSWNHFINRTNYIKEIMSAEKQVSENFSTAGMLAAGLPMAILDLDMLVSTPILAGISKGRKALSLEDRMSKIAEVAIGGAIVGGASMAVYENTTGIYKEDSITNSALMGMALGGALGTFATRASKPAPDFYDTKTGEKIDIAVRKEEELAKVNKELSKLDEAIAIQKNIEDSIKANQAKAKVANTADIAKTKDTLSSVKEELINTFNKAKENVVSLADELKGVKQARNTIIKQTADAVKEVQTLLKTKETNIVKAAEVYNLGVNKEITKLTEELNGAINANRPFKAISNKLEKLKAEQKNISNKINEISTVIRNNNEMLKNSNTFIKDLEQNYLLAKKDSDLKGKSVKEYDARYTKDKKIVSDYSKKLGVSIEKAQELLTKDGFKNLLANKGLLTSRIADIKEEKLDLLGVRKEVHNYVKKLSNELEGVNKELMSMNTLSDAGKLLNKLPDWISRLVISPIENLYKSKNPLVSGLASMLHVGTLHRGLVETRTAYRIKQEFDELLRRHTLAVEYNYRQAVKDGYKGNKEEFETDVSQNIYKTIGKLQRDMSAGISGDKTWQERLEIMKKANINRTYFTDNQHIRNSVDEMLNYYETIHKRGSILGLQNFVGSNSRGYVKRFYDRNKIEAMGRENAIEHLYQAQKAYAESNNFPITKETLDEFRAKATTAVDSSLSRKDKQQAIIKDFGMPRATTTSPFKQRSIDAYDDDLAKLLEDDIFTNSSIYGLSTHGRLAFKEKLGVDNEEQLLKLFEKTGATTKELDNLKVVAQSIMGTREIAKNPFTPGQQIIKGASSLSSLLHTAAFGVPTLTEVASIAKEFGWKSTIEHLIPNIKNVKDIYLNGSPSDKNQIELIAEYGSAYFSTRANRMDIDSPLEATTRIQEKIDGAVHKLSVLGGLLPITDMLRMTTITAGLDFLARMSVKKNISSTDMMRINDMGFDATDLVTIREKLKVDETGRINNMDRKSWGKLDTKITDGLMTMVDRTILHPNGITLPKFMTDVNEGAWISKIMLKFMRFPVESYERLLLRGVQEADAKQMLALAGNIAMWSAILMAKDVLKDEEKQQYNKDDWEVKLFKDSLLNNSWTAFPIALADKSYGLLTGKNLTNNYTHRALGVVAGDAEKIMNGNLTVSLPFYNMNVGDAFGRMVNDIEILDEVWKDNNER